MARSVRKKSTILRTMSLLSTLLPVARCATNNIFIVGDGLIHAGTRRGSIGAHCSMNRSSRSTILSRWGHAVSASNNHHVRRNNPWGHKAAKAAFASLSPPDTSPYQIGSHHNRYRQIPPSHAYQTTQTVGLSILAASSSRYHPGSSSSFTKLQLASDDESGAVATSGGAAYHATANRQIVERRNEVSRKKREARQKSLDRDRERNFRLRQLFSEETGRTSQQRGGEANGLDGSGGDPYAPPPMFAVKVVTCPTLRSELKMNGREKRGRMFVERPPSFLSSDPSEEGSEGADAGEGGGAARENDATDDCACTSLGELKQTIHEFFRRLKKSTYILSASLPTLDEEGNVLTHADDAAERDDDGWTGTWPLISDGDVRNAFLEAEDFFLRHRALNETSALKRPTLILHVTKDPDAKPPPPPPPYLASMPDPNASPTMTMLSFYSFPPGEPGVPDPEGTAERLKRSWRPFRALGRVYVAAEGINAQMAVPTNVLDNFLECCAAPPERGGELSHVLGRHVENGLNVDPVPVDAEEFRSDPPFKNLHVRVRSQIVADGFEKALDWQSAGYDMPPMEWHERLKEAREAARSTSSSSEDGIDDDGGESQKKMPIVLDCRNNYETQVGKFELAEPLNTENFRESWDVLKERLKDVPKDAPIMAYCTGGIRCVKVASYLTQELEFTNVSRLAGGVVAYDRTLNEQAPAEEPMFKGVNYVFDGRMGRRITNDQLGTCYTCGRKTHLVTNCKNSNCHRRMVQCEHCRDSFYGTCSEACKTRVVNELKSAEKLSVENKPFTTTSEEEKKEESDEGITYPTLDAYSSAHSSKTAPLLSEIERNTAAIFPSGAHMVSGSMQGSLLTMLASTSREGRILEIGTFTGYATACFLEGAAAVGKCLDTEKVGSRDGGGPFVLSLERDRRALGLASAHLKAMSEYGIGVNGAEEASKLRSDGLQDFTGDSISFTYDDIAGCELLQVNDALATVEGMAIDNPAQAAFDIAFVDADKTRLMEYVDALVKNDHVLKKGGMIVVDNVLWKGLVLDASSSNGYDSSNDESSEDKELLRKNRRARKLANKMHRFNSAVVKDDRVDVLMMNLRDGLSMIRKR